MKDTRKNTDNIIGAIMGFAVADALGVPAEFMEREELKKNPVTDMIGGGAHNQLPGTWSDDTSMTIATVHSIIEKGIDFEDQMTRFERWLDKAEYTALGNVFDAGMTVEYAIDKHIEGTEALKCGGTTEFSCGNGSLMRILPMAMLLKARSDKNEMTDSDYDLIHKASMLTHAHPRCQMACGIYSAVYYAMCEGNDLSEAVMAGISNGLEYYREKSEFADVYEEFESLTTLQSWTEDRISGSGFVVHTLQAALWCLLTTADYKECALKAVNLGKDTDTVAAVAGGLAGFWYCEKGIPENWIKTLAKADELRDVAARFADHIAV